MAAMIDPDRGRTHIQSSPAAASSSSPPKPSSSNTTTPVRSTQARSTSATRSDINTTTINGGGIDKKANSASAKAKDLSHVRCRFFAAGSCTAGASCSFSHEVVAPGTAKPICKFFTQGNCRFAHKCALAHILPGQPMSFDRKNKRAAQAALREAQANAVGHSIDHSAHSPPNQAHIHSDPTNQSGLARSLQVSGNGDGPSPHSGATPSWSRVAAGNGIAPSNESSPAQMSTSPASRWPPESEEGMSPTATRTTPTANYPTGPSSSSSESPSKHLSPNQPTATFIPAPAPSGLSQTLNQPSNSNARSSVAAQVMLGQQARRLSNNGDSLSPPRMIPSLSARRSDFGMGTSPPLAIPTSNTGAVPGASIFGTSPFSGGSRALFLPSSYDSNEDGFPRSPPARGGNLMAEHMKRTTSAGLVRPGGIVFAQHNTSALEDDAEDEDNDEEDDVFNSEGFLPSSLNDLLTPDEMKRRAMRSMGLASPSFDPFQNSRSVPPDMMLSRGRPTLSASNASSSLIPGRDASWGALSASAEGTNPTAQPYSPTSPLNAPRSLLSVSRDHHPSSGSPSSSSSFLSPTADRNILSSTFDIPSSNFGHRPSVKFGADLSPALQPLPAPGSLPGGLAAGLSQLHLIPPLHTGDTPPSSLGAHSSPWNSTQNAQSSKSTSSEIASNKTWATIASSSPTNSSNLRPPAPMSRRSISGAANGVASPLSKNEIVTEDEGLASAGEEDEMQFSMDT